MRQHFLLELSQTQHSLALICCRRCAAACCCGAAATAVSGCGRGRSRFAFGLVFAVGFVRLFGGRGRVGGRFVFVFGLLLQVQSVQSVFDAVNHARTRTRRIQNDGVDTAPTLASVTTTSPLSHQSTAPHSATQRSTLTLCRAARNWRYVRAHSESKAECQPLQRQRPAVCCCSDSLSCSALCCCCSVLCRAVRSGLWRVQ